MKMNILLAFLLLLPVGVKGQKVIAWDDTTPVEWRGGFELVDIPSTKDGSMQKAYLYRSRKSSPQPLIVSLHTWSGNYKQKDPLVAEVIARGWNYIHPDFRGANNKPDAMGSPLVISDIEDAIRYALRETGADPGNVHIVGVSGGGFATLAAYMNLDYPVASFSAWAPISCIETWYWESVGRGQKYAKDIMKAIGNGAKPNMEEAARRSPLRQTSPGDKRKGIPLYIYEGVHDGYKGSVPITHSINMYNRVVGEQKYGTADMDIIMRRAMDDPDLVSPQEIIGLLSKRTNPEADGKNQLYGRAVYLSRSYNNVHLTIFEGGHEQLPQALGLIPYQETNSLRKNILTLGDSNAAMKEGWAEQLRKMLPNSNIVNISRSGRTIGFNNMKTTATNALANIRLLLDEAKAKAGKNRYDYVVLCLGTNDAKAQYADSLQTVYKNYEALLSQIKKYKWGYKTPQIICVTPPPLEEKADKYKGAGRRLEEFVPRFTEIAYKKKARMIDCHTPLRGVHEHYAPDGVHMTEDGQKIIASMIVESLIKE